LDDVQAGQEGPILLDSSKRFAGVIPAIHFRGEKIWHLKCIFNLKNKGRWGVSSRSTLKKGKFMKKKFFAFIAVALAAQVVFAGGGSVGSSDDNTSAMVTWAAIKGSCQIGNDVALFDFPRGNGSAFPVIGNKIQLSIFAGPSESFGVDEKGVNLIDISISAADKKGKHLGSTFLRNLTANPKVAREFSIDLYDGTILNCKF
jgi:hypothetical protein